MMRTSEATLGRNLTGASRNILGTSQHNQPLVSVAVELFFMNARAPTNLSPSLS